MRRRIGVVIRLDLDDQSAHALDQQRCADQIRRHRMDAAVEKSTVEAGGLRHGVD
jgi:hypothetical protein